MLQLTVTHLFNSACPHVFPSDLFAKLNFLHLEFDLVTLFRKMMFQIFPALGNLLLLWNKMPLATGLVRLKYEC